MWVAQTAESRAVRQTLTDILTDPANINRLEVPILQSAASLAFLAVLVKDVGRTWLPLPSVAVPVRF